MIAAGNKEIYLDEIAIQIKNIAEPDSEMDDKEWLLYRIYAVLLIAKGVEVNERDVHDAWSVWAFQHYPNHVSIKPFEELPKSLQIKDTPYVTAIHKVARKNP